MCHHVVSCLLLLGRLIIVLSVWDSTASKLPHVCRRVVPFHMFELTIKHQIFNVRVFTTLRSIVVIEKYHFRPRRLSAMRAPALPTRLDTYRFFKKRIGIPSVNISVHATHPLIVTYLIIWKEQTHKEAWLIDELPKICQWQSIAQLRSDEVNLYHNWEQVIFNVRRYISELFFIQINSVCRFGWATTI